MKCLRSTTWINRSIVSAYIGVAAARLKRQGSILLCHAPTVRLMKRRVFSRPGQIQFEVNAFSLAWSWHDKPKIPWQWSHVLSPSTRSYILMEYQRQRMIRPSTVNLPYPYSLWLTPHDSFLVVPWQERNDCKVKHPKARPGHIRFISNSCRIIRR